MLGIYMMPGAKRRKAAAGLLTTEQSGIEHF